MNNATTIPSRTVRALPITIVIILATIWILGLGGVIHLPLALVWILPFACLILGAIVVLWASGAFNT